jgi:alpha-glucoside transport system permease protein
MTRATVRDRNRPTAHGQEPFSPGLRRLLDRVPTFVLFLIAGLWTLPTAGLAVSSLRNWPSQQSGWWTDLFNIETWTLDGYRAAVSVSVNNSFAEGMFNSFAIAVPATLLPLSFASLAAYAIG